MDFFIQKLGFWVDNKIYLDIEKHDTFFYIEKIMIWSMTQYMSIILSELLTKTKNKKRVWICHLLVQNRNSVFLLISFSGTRITGN